jgi:hypothetical protein
MGKLFVLIVVDCATRLSQKGSSKKKSKRRFFMRCRSL